MEPTPSAPRPAKPAGVTPFARNATGLVRELPLLDMLTYNASAATPLAAVMALSLFSVLVAFPGANLLVTLPLALVGGLFLWVTYSLMSASMPRIGGDYLFVSRVIHPAVGLASNACAVCAGLTGAGFVAYAGVKLALAPTLQMIGVLSGNSWWLHTATTVLEKGWTFAIGAVAVIATGVLAAIGTRFAGRIMTILYAIAFVGGIVVILIALFTSRSNFTSHLNSFSRSFTHMSDTYNGTIRAGAKAGLRYPSVAGYSSANTIGAIVLVYGFSSAYQWGVYMSGEMKGAGRRSRQLTSMVGAALSQGVLLLLAILILTHTVGYNFLTASAGGSYAVPVAAYPNFFVGVIAGKVLAGLLGLSLLCAFLPWLYANSSMTYRAPFAWAFDGLISRRFTTVSERHHTPVFAITAMTVVCVGIVAWAAFSSNFLTVIAFSFLWAYVSFALVGLAALLMPSRRREQYRGSGGEWKLGGMPVLPVAGGLTVVWNLFMIYLGLHYHTQVGIAHVSTAVYVIGGTIVVGAVYYFLASAFQRRRGIDISLAFRGIPPE